MLNYLWAGMILISIIVAAFTGRMPELTNATLDSAKETVTVCLTMLGVMSMWTGLMKIAEKGGLIKLLSDKMAPLLKFLFPRLKKGSKACEHIATNMIANVLGLGWAATPAGIKAMEELQKINPDKTTASREMCMFMIINMSSLQLVTMSTVAYRAQYSSVNATEIIGPGILATMISTIVAVIFAKIMDVSKK